MELQLPPTVDVTFSVWNTANFEGLMTSQDLGRPEPVWLTNSDIRLFFRISANGKFVLFRSGIYELP